MPKISLHQWIHHRWMSKHNAHALHPLQRVAAVLNRSHRMRLVSVHIEAVLGIGTQALHSQSAGTSTSAMHAPASLPIVWCAMPPTGGYGRTQHKHAVPQPLHAQPHGRFLLGRAVGAIPAKLAAALAPATSRPPFAEHLV